MLEKNRKREISIINESDFKDIQLHDKQIIKTYLSKTKYLNSEYNFTTLYAWQEAYNIKYAIYNDCLCLVGKVDGKDYCYFPVGDDDKAYESFVDMFKMFRKQEKDFLLVSASERMLNILKQKDLCDCFCLEEKRDFFDYVYKREKLVTLSGKKLHGKRNHFNFFANNYKHELVNITSENEKDCEKLFSSLIMERSESAEEELNATLKILRNREELGMTGKCLYIEGNLSGVILAEQHHGMALIEIAKADLNYRGAAVALFKLFLEQNFVDCEYVNFMEDLGIEGLRKAKMSYSPDMYIEKYSLDMCKDIPLTKKELDLCFERSMLKD